MGHYSVIVHEDLVEVTRSLLFTLVARVYERAHTKLPTLVHKRYQNEDERNVCGTIMLSSARC